MALVRVVGMQDPFGRIRFLLLAMAWLSSVTALVQKWTPHSGINVSSLLAVAMPRDPIFPDPAVANT